jgi:hypothetical protein
MIKRAVYAFFTLDIAIGVLAFLSPFLGGSDELLKNWVIAQGAIFVGAFGLIVIYASLYS